MKLAGWGFMAAAALLAAACDDGVSGGPGGSGGSISPGGSGGAGGSGGSAGSGPSCDELPPPVIDGDFGGFTPEVPALLDADIPGSPKPEGCPEEDVWTSTVRGWVIAPGGEPLRCAYAQVCVHYFNIEKQTKGYVCLSPAEADADGVFTNVLPESMRCVERAALRVLLPGSGRSTSYCPMGEPVDGVLRLRDPIMLPQIPTASSAPPLGDETMARMVEWPEGVKLEVTPSLYVSNTGSYEQLGVRPIPTDAVGLCGEAPTFDGLFATYREGSVKSPGWPIVTVPNRSGLAPGTRVEFFVLGGLECSLDGTTVPEATWAPFGEGQVSGDGVSVSSDAGVGLPCITWFGYREKT